MIWGNILAVYNNIVFSFIIFSSEDFIRMVNLAGPGADTMALHSPESGNTSIFWADDMIASLRYRDGNMIFLIINTNQPKAEWLQRDPCKFNRLSEGEKSYCINKVTIPGE